MFFGGYGFAPYGGYGLGGLGYGYGLGYPYGGFGGFGWWQIIALIFQQLSRANKRFNFF